MPPVNAAQIRRETTALHYQYRERLPMWTIFGPGTADYPGKFLARLCFSLPEVFVTDVLLHADSLEDIRDLLPVGLVALSRAAADDPNIIETWL